jgi:hypothetical protein
MRIGLFPPESESESESETNAWRREAEKRITRSRRLRVRGRARPGTFRERADPCQHCGLRHDERMRTASAATFRVDRALSLPPAARLRAFYRRHAAARSKAAAAGSRGSRARCIHRLSRAQSWVLLVKRPPPTRGAPSQPMARAEALLDRVLLIRFRGRFPIATSAKDRTGPQLQVTDHADLPRTRAHRLGSVLASRCRPSLLAPLAAYSSQVQQPLTHSGCPGQASTHALACTVYHEQDRASS